MSDNWHGWIDGVEFTSRESALQALGISEPATDARELTWKIAGMFCYPTDYPGIDEATAEIERYVQSRLAAERELHANDIVLARAAAEWNSDMYKCAEAERLAWKARAEAAEADVEYLQERIRALLAERQKWLEDKPSVPMEMLAKAFDLGESMVCCDFRAEARKIAARYGYTVTESKEGA